MAVVEHGGFRRAAEALHITQPAVSQQIRQLSGLIKRPVFASTGREMRLSPQGEELLEYARRMVALNDEAVARFVPEAGQVLLSVGVTSQLAEVLPEFLRRVNRGLPQVQLRVRTGASEALAQQLSTGQLDAALLLQAARRTRGRTPWNWAGCAWPGSAVPPPANGIPFRWRCSPRRAPCADWSARSSTVRASPGGSRTKGPS